MRGQPFDCLVQQILPIAKTEACEVIDVGFLIKGAYWNRRHPGLYSDMAAEVDIIAIEAKGAKAARQLIPSGL